jgi:isopentenyl-diphosphate delta-isomerase
MMVEGGTSGFADVRLVHNALPECDMDAILTSTRFLGHQLSSPLFIAAMTGGHPDTHEVNLRLARASERFGIGMGVGSQRAALEDPELEGSFTVVREEAPGAFLCANLGIIQLRDHGPEWADRAVEMIDAQALCVHLNPLQEAIQPEGDHNVSGCLDALGELCSACSYPVIAKETGGGISCETAKKLWSSGVTAIDIGGWGGTNWAAVERVRVDSPAQDETADLLTDWGIPTVVSLMETAPYGGPVIATGGVRSGIDIAKAIALGADLAGMALPLLKPAMQGEEALYETIESVNHQLKIAMFLTGSGSISELGRVRTYITGMTRQMLNLEE